MRRALVLIAGLLVLGLAAVAFQAAHDIAAYDVASLAKRVPSRTALMRQRITEARREGRDLRIDQRWVPYARISPFLRRAVLTAEDNAFFSHGGLDWHELRAAAKKNLEAGHVVRGGSTITQQLAKNLFLGEERTPVRKLRELLLALRMERALSKRRIFELYLNLIEWGDGIYGVEAAARRHFGVSAADLDPRQASLLAAVIINPRRYSARAPARRIERRVAVIASRMRKRGFLSEDQYLVAIGRQPERPSLFEWFFGGGPSDWRPPEPAPESAAGGGIEGEPELEPDTTVMTDSAGAP